MRIDGKHKNDKNEQTMDGCGVRVDGWAGRLVGWIGAQTAGAVGWRTSAYSGNWEREGERERERMRLNEAMKHVC